MFVIAATAFAAAAHEVRPAIADLMIEGQSLTLDLQLNVEAFVAGINLTDVTDTNEAAQAKDYDSLRAKDPEAMEADFRRFWPQMQAGLNIMVGPERIIPDLTAVVIGDIGDIDLPRDSHISMTAILPANDEGVTVGWDRSFGPLVLRQTGAAETAYTGYLTDGQSSAVIPRTGTANEGALRAFGTYIKIGFEHILPKGLDHILFVLGLFFLSLKARPLLLQVTAFTLAHTVALALGILGYVTVPATIVEPLIAASIVYVAVENILTKDIIRWRPFVVFAFGLLHGLGFASVLGEIGLDPQRFVLGLIGFNIGVELGQLTVIALAFLAVGAWFRQKDWYRSRISNPASLGIALVGGYWFIERVWI
ncbi:HupE/UreJ family protein [Pseudogemmobacter sp. W21_MBD1_M6]|uniref:HupE/UreJ family protein n=1 Tax=Pseudogemmobacter sp. W21_MBD1_M6 TaxID=3240271 RepID=UPI003F9A01F5